MVKNAVNVRNELPVRTWNRSGGKKGREASKDNKKVTVTWSKSHRWNEGWEIGNKRRIQ